MIYTNLEALVEQEKWELLKKKYEEIEKGSLSESLLSSHLIQDQIEPKLWRIITFWQSREDLEKYRASVETPAWILVFRAVGVEPKLSISDIISSK